MNSERWVGVGQSADLDSATAGASARDAALAGRDDARLLIVFASPAYDLPALLRGITPGDVPLVGCSTAGEITPAGPTDRGVVVLALGGAGFAVCTRAARGASERLRAAGAEVARCAETVEPRPHRALLLLSDGLVTDQQAIVRGAYDIVGSTVPLVGGGAGSASPTSPTYQFHGEEVLQDAVVGIALGSDAPLGIGVQHGWRRMGEPVLVTRSEGRRLYEIDDRPALDVYLEWLDAPADARHDAAAFAQFAASHPLGLGRRSGEDHVRFVAGADFEDRSLHCAADVPPGGIAFFMEGDAESVLGAADTASANALEGLGGAPALGMLAFDCIARRHFLGDEGVVDEVARIGAAGGAPVAGFYTYGEIARTRGISGFHNQTLVVMALA